MTFWTWWVLIGVTLAYLVDVRAINRRARDLERRVKDLERHPRDDQGRWI